MEREKGNAKWNWTITIIGLLLINQGFAQLNDKTWICGGTNSGKVIFNTPIDTVRFTPEIDCSYQWACISNSSGVFQFFTDGVNVYSYDGTPMVNGDSLADNSVNATFTHGLPDWQNVIVLPKSDSQYYIIYQSQSDTSFANDPWYYTNRLYYAIVDMSLKNGKGEVTVKRQLINSSFFMDGHFTACQHANGRDWWLVQRGYSSNRYFIYLVTPDAILYIRDQFIGADSNEPDAVGQSAFSPDGSKYASITGKSPLILLDFDRCEGIFSNPQKVIIPMDTFMFYGNQEIQGGGGDGLCFSPNNRFVYVNSLFILRQYDLQSNPIDSSEQVIFFWTDTNEAHGQFNQMHLGPDGKIYVAPFQGFTYALNVINHPDSAGLSCGFVKWGLPLPTNDASVIPNMVHFRMGALVGSGCDTLHTELREVHAEKEKLLKIYPNPATNLVTIDYGYTDWNMGGVSLELSNELGQVVYTQALPMYSGFQTVQLSSYPAGFYTASIRRKGSVVAAAKFAKQ